MTAFDDLVLLRAFVRIVESGGISAAARSLKLPQPSLSRHLRTLEDRAGTTLLLRDTHRMRLTEAGHRLLEDARSLLTLAENANDRLRQDQGGLRGHVRIFATIDIGQSALSRILSRFLQLHPGVSAELSYSNRPVTMIEGGYDAGVVAGELTDPNVVARKLALIERAVVASPRYLKKLPKPKEPSDLKALRWLSLSPSQFGGSSDAVTLVGRKTTQTLRIAPVLVAEGVTSMREAVRSGLGVCVLPLWLIQQDLATGQLVRVLPEFTPTSFSLSAIHLAGRPLPSRVRALLDFVALEMPAELRGETT